MTLALTHFTVPFTASGRSALVPPPPWHYAGWIMNVAVDLDPSRSADLIPPELGVLTGKGCIHFADWQSTTDGHELVDPVYAQYRETLVIVEIQRPTQQRFNYCPFIWVDQDISLVRGLLQGWPKKMGSTYLTRTLPIAHIAAAPLQAGSRMGASLSVKERRLIEVTLTLTGEKGHPYGLLVQPTIGTVGWPDLTQPEQGPQVKWVLPKIQDQVRSEWQDAEASLQILPHPIEELCLLGEVTAERASVGWIGLTIMGAMEI